MRARLVLVPLAVLPFLPGTAHAAPQGQLCSMRTFTDPTVPSVQTGTVEGGPATMGGAGPVTLICSVHVNGSLHADVDAAAVAASANGAASVPSTAIAYAWAPGDVVHLCTEVDDGSTGINWYWDAGTSAWSTSPLTLCVAATMTPFFGGSLHTV
jgi:hypothetical protein